MDFIANDYYMDHIALNSELSNSSKQILLIQKPVPDFKTIKLGNNLVKLHLKSSDNSSLNIEKVRELAPKQSKYINKLAKENSAFLEELFEGLSGANNVQIGDFFEVSEILNLNPKIAKDHDTLLKLAKIAKETNNCSRLIYGPGIRDNWFKNIIENDSIPFEDLISKVMYSSKPSYLGVPIKNGNLFANTDPNGNIRKELNESTKYGESNTLGLVMYDTQFLSNYVLSIYNDNKRQTPENLIKVSTDNHGSFVEHKLENKNVSVLRSQLVNKKFIEKITVKNLSGRRKVVRLDISSIIGDIFELRGFWVENRILKKPVIVQDGSVIINTEIACKVKYRGQ